MIKERKNKKRNRLYEPAPRRDFERLKKRVEAMEKKLGIRFKKK